MSDQDEINSLKIKIIEREDLIQHMVKYQVPFSIQGYRILFDDILSDRIKLAKLQYDVAIKNRNQVMSN
jgi:putative effector of murein hydrolase LrgA (UPF0299 family)